MEKYTRFDNEKVVYRNIGRLAKKFDSIVTRGQRSKVIAKLIEEVKRHEDKLYKAALKLEKNETLNEKMEDWDIATEDVIEK